MTRRFPPSRYETAAAESTDPEELARLAEHASSFVKSAVARNPHTTADTLRILAAAGDKYVDSRIAGHPNTPADLLAALASSTDGFVQAGVASNPNADPSALERLASAGARVRERVAANKATPAETLLALATDREAEIRIGVARNRNTPDAAVIILSGDSEAEVRHALARRLADRNTEFREVVRQVFNGRLSSTQTLRIPIEAGGRFSEPVIRAFAAASDLELVKTAASQPDAPQDVLLTLARHEDKWVQVRVAANPAASEPVLHALLDNGAPEVLREMAECHDDLPDAVLARIALSRVPTAHTRLSTGSAERLLDSADAEVRAAAAKIIDPTDGDLWRRLLDDGATHVRVAGARGVGSFAVLAEYAACSDKAVRQVVAERAADPEMLRRLAADADTVVRRRVAANPRCPADALAALAGDRDARVRALAAERFLTALGG